ncbi:MAG TPA: hypothetical protein VLJ76_01985 [Gaiellaceae bacterium]|nr:hypothetical protein [Gaiellaceae bacterium]
MAGTHHDEHVTTLLGGGLLSERMRHGNELSVVDPRSVQTEEHDPRGEVSLGRAAEVEISGEEVQFLVPFVGPWPNEFWMQAYHQAQGMWPHHLDPARIDEGRGLRLGPIPVGLLEEHVRAAKTTVAAANRIYLDEIEPELRRRREEAERREQEELRIQTEVEAKLKYLLG